MRVCRQYGIPHSHLLGGPPRWTEADQDKAIAFESFSRSVCGQCGTRLDEWEEDPHAYVGHTWRCPGCEIVEMEQQQVPEGQKGVQVGLVPYALAD